MGFLKVEEQNEVIKKIRVVLNAKYGEIKLDPEICKNYYLWHYGLVSVPKEYWSKIACEKDIYFEIEKKDSHDYFSRYNIRVEFDEEVPVPNKYRIRTIHLNKDLEFSKDNKYVSEADKKFGEEIIKVLRKYVEREELIAKIKSALKLNKTEMQEALSEELWNIVEKYKLDQINVKGSITKLTI